MEKESKRQINVGIGFITGRKNFQRVLKTYVYNWRESGLTSEAQVTLNLLVAYDLKYSNTKSSQSKLRAIISIASNLPGC